MITLQTRKWSIAYYANTNPVRKYCIHLHAISDDTGIFPVFPISIVESGKPGLEVYTATYPDMTKSGFTSLSDMAFHFNSAIEWFESMEDFN
jgi:hypothetical protein